MLTKVGMEYILHTLTQTSCQSLTTRHLIRPISRPREIRRPILVPAKLLCPDRPGTPSVAGIQHAMVHDPILLAVWRRREAGVPDPIRLLLRILVEDATLVVLSPIHDIHRVGAHELQLAEAIVAIVGACARVNDEVLIRLGIDQLLRPFVGRKSIVDRAAIRRLFPCIGRRADDLAIREVGADGVRILHCSRVSVLPGASCRQHEARMN